MGLEVKVAAAATVAAGMGAGAGVAEGSMRVSGLSSLSRGPQILTTALGAGAGTVAGI